MAIVAVASLKPEEAMGLSGRPRHLSAESGDSDSNTFAEVVQAGNLTLAAASVEPGKFNDFSGLAMTWRIDPRYPFLLAPGKRIFDERPEEVSRRPLHTHHSQLITSESSKEFG